MNMYQVEVSYNVAGQAGSILITVEAADVLTAHEMAKEQFLARHVDITNVRTNSSKSA